MILYPESIPSQVFVIKIKKQKDFSPFAKLYFVSQHMDTFYKKYDQ